jgi:hypothetical protein
MMQIRHDNNYTGDSAGELGRKKQGRPESLPCGKREDRIVT